jgi:hypothetical protein
MKYRVVTGIVGLMAVGLVGCTPPPEAVVPTEDTAVVSPAEVTPPPSPAPEWTEEEQIVIDSVDAYYAKWSEMSQDLTVVDPNDIYEVAKEPLVDVVMDDWFQWLEIGLHLVGEVSFEPVNVDRVVLTEDGQSYYVDGCQNLGDSYRAFADGTPDEQTGRVDSISVTVEVVHTPDGFYLVTDTRAWEAGSC